MLANVDKASAPKTEFNLFEMSPLRVVKTVVGLMTSQSQA